ncbi:MAG: helix-hairpin-helix domain-containing protein, partial [Gammaproteobacteria bacterium]
LIEQFMAELDVDEEVAAILVQEGFASIDEIAYVPLPEMLTIEEFDEEIVTELRERAKDALLTRAIAKEESFPDAEPADDLLALEGMDADLAKILAARGVVTMEDLAEQSVDDLVDIEGLDEEKAGRLIMTARAPWFEEAAQGQAE